MTSTDLEIADVVDVARSIVCAIGRSTADMNVDAAAVRFAMSRATAETADVALVVSFAEPATRPFTAEDDAVLNDACAESRADESAAAERVAIAARARCGEAIVAAAALSVAAKTERAASADEDACAIVIFAENRVAATEADLTIAAAMFFVAPVTGHDTVAIMVVVAMVFANDVVVADEVCFGGWLCSVVRSIAPPRSWRP